MADQETSNLQIAPESQGLRAPAIPNEEGPAEGADSSRISINESQISTSPLELAPHLRVVKPSRPSLTYERVE